MIFISNIIRRVQRKIILLKTNINSYVINVKAFGWHTGLKLPILIHGPIKVYSIGNIEIKCPIQKGLLIIGLNECDVPYSHTIFNNQGTIEIYGKTYINFGSKIKNNGRMVFRGNNIVGHGVSFVIQNSFEIGVNSTIGFMSVITDTNTHYTIDIPSRSIRCSSSPIKIGSYNWIGSYTFVKKGAITPDYTIVSSPNAMVGKDYTSIEPYSILAGCPAKVLRTGLRRIYNFKTEHMLNRFFKENPQNLVYKIDENQDFDDFCQMYI